MQFRQAILVADGRTYQLEPGKSNSFETFFADFQRTEILGEHLREAGSQYSIFLHPKQDITVQLLEIQFDVSLSDAARFFANGYQSWSESRWMPVTGRIPALRPFGTGRFSHYGDDWITGIPRGNGRLHSWSYTLLHNGASDKVTFLGSLNESTGFTLFLYNRSDNTLTVRKDMAGLQLSHSFPTLDFAVLSGPEKDVYAAYFQLLGINKASRQPNMVGWGSAGITPRNNAKPLGQRLEDFSALYETLGAPESAMEQPAAFFEAGDGWPSAVGDWLSAKEDMGKLAAQIREKGMQPAIWLAPFVASADSELVKKHSDWLLKDNKNKPIKAGWNPQWGGWVYALDFYHREVQAWLAGVFHVVCEKWGYERLHLDYLYAVCLASPPGKTRGQVMHDAMQFLRELVGRRFFLADGVPLGSAFGLADACRVGAPLQPVWERKLEAFLHRRERGGALPTLRSALHRWPLGSAFGVDSGGIILQKEGQKLSPEQQYTLLTINALLGNHLCTSDDVSAWSAEQTAEYTEAVALLESHVNSVTEIQENLFRINFELRSDIYNAFCNLSGKRRQVGPELLLQPYETIVLALAGF